MGDKQDAARVAWATIKLALVGQRPVSLDQLATHVGRQWRKRRGCCG